MTDEAANESLRVEIEQSGMIVTMLQIYGLDLQNSIDFCLFE